MNMETTSQPAGMLSQLGRTILELQSEGAYERLVVDGPGHPQAKQMLETAEAAALLSRPVQSTNDAQSVLSALWLWHDWLDESHRVSQQIHTPTGNFWHAIMHRREGDFSNSKYWYAHCEAHPAMPVIAVQAAASLNPYGADNSLVRIVANGWNAAAFVDLVEQVHRQPQDPRHRAAVALQQLEWRVLFDHCLRAAAGM
jgi:hypothetical protein